MPDDKKKAETPSKDAEKDLKALAEREAQAAEEAARKDAAKKIEDDLDLILSYHPPTEAKALKYEIIRREENKVEWLIDQIEQRVACGGDAESWVPEMHNEVNASLRPLGRAILTECPPSADRSASIRNFRLLRMSLNEIIACHRLGRSTRNSAILLTMAREHLLRCRLEANSSIALDGKNV